MHLGSASHYVLFDFTSWHHIALIRSLVLASCRSLRSVSYLSPSRALPLFTTPQMHLSVTNTCTYIDRRFLSNLATDPQSRRSFSSAPTSISANAYIYDTINTRSTNSFQLHSSCLSRLFPFLFTIWISALRFHFFSIRSSWKAGWRLWLLAGVDIFEMRVDGCHDPPS